MSEIIMTLKVRSLYQELECTHLLQTKNPLLGEMASYVNSKYCGSEVNMLENHELQMLLYNVFNLKP